MVGELDDRLGIAKGGRVFLDKIFPDHWSFMLGEIALYSFVVLIATGIFLSLYFVPSTNQVLYHGTYRPLDGQWVSEAYRSTVNISFDVRGGLLVRQMHHWAADIFTGSIVVHMARIFFTGAFRKPRELNWTIGIIMLILAIFEGFIGYSLPDDLISGTGLRIGYSIAESIPLVGSYLVSFLWGGQLPRRHHHPALLHHPRPDHPAGPARVDLGPPRPAGAPEAHAVRRRGAHRGQRGRLAHVPHVHGQDDRLPLHGDGRLGPARRVRPDQPHLAVRLVRRVQDLLRRPARLVHGLARRRPAHHAVVGVRGLRAHHPLRGRPPRRRLPGPIFTICLLWPALERRWTGDNEMHNLLDRPRNRPKRTAAGVAMIGLLFTLFVASSTDVLANFFHVSLNATLWFFRIAVFVVPIIAGLVAYQLCKEMQGVQGIGQRKRAVIVRRSAQGEYSTVPAAPRPDDVQSELGPEPVPERIDVAPLVTNGPSVPETSPTGVRQVTR